MSKYALEVKNLYKSFNLPTEQANGIKQAFVNWTKGVKGYKKQEVLKNISFTVEKGDFFGIVGRNGCGKSTLLKLISDIYSPDSGEVIVNGKLIPFIELGVGFNPELTGRENVYLNGALLGFSHDEVEDMYDEIVDFAELEQFMDQKLKNYSSGMQVRLAFSIAIRANTDILVLDEVLAVGDEAFQRKCFEYFKQIKKQKKTVILVTHDMASVRRFCNKAIMLESGKIVASGDPNEVANLYSIENIESTTKTDKKSKKNTAYIQTRVENKVLTPKDTLEVEVKYFVPEDRQVSFGISILDEASNRITSVIDDGFFIDDNNVEITSSKKGTHIYKYTLPLDLFNNRDFEITATLFAYDKKKDSYEPIAYTTEEGISQFYVRENKPRGGLLKKRGSWMSVKSKKEKTS